jgi:hypothetical protein
MTACASHQDGHAGQLHTASRHPPSLPTQSRVSLSFRSRPREFSHCGGAGGRVQEAGDAATGHTVEQHRAWVVLRAALPPPSAAVLSIGGASAISHSVDGLFVSRCAAGCGRYPDIAALGGQKNPYCVVVNGKRHAAASGNDLRLATNPRGGAPCVAGGAEGVAGTSAASPTAAAIFARLNGVRLAAGKPPLGFLNPFIYQASPPALRPSAGTVQTGLCL